MITHVAVKVSDGRVWSLPKPYRHGDVITLMGKQHTDCSFMIAGFVNDTGVFLTRKEAWFEAHQNGQILPPYNPIDPSQRVGVPSDQPGDLFSEDLW